MSHVNRFPRKIRDSSKGREWNCSFHSFGGALVWAAMRRQNPLALCLLMSFSLLGCRPEGAEEKALDNTETQAVVESTPTPVLAPVATPRRDWT